MTAAVLSPRNAVTIVRRLGWGVADQVVSSISNFVLGIVVARSLGAEGFGSFSLAFITYAFILSGSRGLSTAPLLVRFSGPRRRSGAAPCRPPRRRRPASERWRARGAW